MVTLIRLSAQEENALEQVAQARQVTIEELIQQSIRSLINSAAAAERPSDEVMAERRRRGLAAVGGFHSGFSDISVEHDKSLAEDFAE